MPTYGVKYGGANSFFAEFSSLRDTGLFLAAIRADEPEIEFVAVNRNTGKELPW